MKFKTKIISFLIVLSLLSSLLCTTLVSSATETYFEANLSGQEFVIKGQNYTLNLTFENFKADEFLGATALIDYNSDIFDIVSCSIINPEDGWEVWTNNEILGADSIYSLTVVYGDLSQIHPLKGDSIVCQIELLAKETAESCESIIKIDTDEDLDGVFSETLIEKKYGKGSSVSVLVDSALPKLKIKDDSNLIYQTNKITSMDFLTGFDQYTTVEEFISQFDNPSKYIQVVLDGTVCSADDYVCTGAEVQFIIDGNVVDSMKIFCRGDVDGNGAVNSTDYLRIKSYFIGSMKLEGAFLAGSDLDDSGSIDATDYLKIKSFFLGYIESLN